ncbi:unnamed protein product [Kuraishia capsulata CBS 1993]|uniref:K Homology domain-containing protein n=1 Tax=Kuraishia capsulata CBS 1993 TaxID=1382522 RepID=W6MY49_9ASCO|nr:uncharacterized protein KUCA_T00006010001 [Kuraishia capsulata CBS 1993]CDK30015.1 unnamed protein product [Kuraishia capsulata CBS 1993]
MSQLFEPESAAQDPVLTTSADVFPAEVDVSSVPVTYRILVSRREAGVIIGKNGDCITQIRDGSGVKAGVSRLVEGCADRILTVTGAIENVSQALGLFARALAESQPQPQSQSQPQGSIPAYTAFPLKPLCPAPVPPNAEIASLRLMIPHALMGTLIGKQGIRIKAIQESHHVKMVASKDFLAGSTERIVEIQGPPSDISEALTVISKCLLEDWHSATGTNYYFPSKRAAPAQRPRLHADPASGAKDASELVKFPGELVGALIGKKGARIQEIRRDSGCTISIEPEDDQNGERAFALTGSPENVERALTLLYGHLERERQRRALVTSNEE